MFKKIAMIILLALSLVGLGACGNEETSKNEESAGKRQIEYWHVNAETQGGKTVEELVEKFNSSQDEIEVVARFNPDMYKGLMQNLQAEQAAGKSPAVVQIGWAFLEYFDNNFDYTSPTDLIANYDSENASYLEDTFLDNILDLAKVEGKGQVGLPYSLSTPVIYINKDILREAGLDENGPKSWEEVREFSKTIKDKTGKYGLYIQEPADFWAQQALIESNGGRIIEDGKAAFASKEGIDAMQLYADMVNVDQTAVHVAWDQGVQSFIDGTVAMCYTTIARRAQIQENAKFDAGAVMSPEFTGKERRIPAGGCFLAVTASDDKDKEAAWKFMKFLYEIENSAAWTIGTGYVPPRIGVDTAEEGLKSFNEENEMMQVAVDQMGYVVPWASFPGDAGLEAEQSLLDMRDQILGGDLPAADAMKETQEKINSLL